jgi:hypothetical protein
MQYGYCDEAVKDCLMQQQMNFNTFCPCLWILQLGGHVTTILLPELNAHMA